MAMIYTLTPNPSVDRTATVRQIRFNTILRSNDLRLDWGGKGFNVSRSLKEFGENSLALGWVGGDVGRMLEHGLNKLGVQTDFNWVDGETRINTNAIEEGGEWYIKLNEPGPYIPPDAIESLLVKAESYAHHGDIWVLGGSLPPGVPDDFFARLIKCLNAKGARVFFDTSGEPLRLGCVEGPFLVKPNAEEAESMVGFKISNHEDGKRAVLPFLRMGIQHVALTIGNKGMLLATQQEMVWAAPPKVPVINVTGAGDAATAGMVTAFNRNHTLTEIARWGVAAGTVSVMHAGVSELPIEEFKMMLGRIETRTLNFM